MTDPEEPSPARSLADKIDHLFKTVHPAGRGEYTYKEVADSLRAGGDPAISASYVWQLRKGIKDNPTKKHLEALSAFFGVPPAYFFDDTVTARIDAQLALLAAMRDAGVEHVALRAAGLSADSLGAITGIIEHARRLEGLPDGPGGLGQDGPGGAS
jgi:transcriptional regulator with XRE-family HTH domain